VRSKRQRKGQFAKCQRKSDLTSVNRGKEKKRENKKKPWRFSFFEFFNSL